MLKTTVLRAMGLAVILFSSIPTGLRAGDSGPADATRKSQTQIVYTGRLMGYFRAPDLQSGKVADTCDSSALDNGSREAKAFDAARQSAPNAILVGTGDNFAPRFEARTFDPPPDPLKPTKGVVQPAGKDQYIWYPDDLANPGLVLHTQPAGKWIRADEVPPMKDLERFLRAGKGLIPADNVACFLLREGYTAVVPGRHDFYFGPERLRNLARFLASNPTGKSVQMLASNLIIDTSWKDDHKPLPDDEFKLGFAPHWPSKFASASDPPFPSLLSPADGKKVYPWLPGATIKLMKLDPNGSDSSRMLYRLIYDENAGQPQTDQALKAFLANTLNSGRCPAASKCSEDASRLKGIVDKFNSTQNKVYLCQSAEPGRPNSIPVEAGSPCLQTPLDWYVWMDRNSVGFLLKFPKPLQPNQNYGLCLTGDNLPPIKNGAKLYCQRFSVYQPLFSFPSQQPSAADPRPYTFVKADPDQGKPLDVAIFGALDPDIPDYVGALNLQWQNVDEEGHPAPYKTTAAVRDPAEGIRETVDAFLWCYQKEHGKRFDGLKILLAQMGPQHAQALATRLGGFDVVITAADPELASGLHKTTYDWTPGDSFPRDYQGIIAVPKSYDPTSFGQDEPVPIGSLNISVDPAPKGAWTVDSEMLRAGSVPQSPSSPLVFWNAAKTALQNGCGLAEPASSNSELIKTLTMCAIQKELGADVVLLQDRDFYVDIPSGVNDAGVTPGALQKILDRILWKGDFLIPLNMPGSALIQALQQSDKYKADDASALSLTDERQRSLVYVGIRHDADRDEYLVNDVPLDKNRLYVVATSDYIGVGDTGYPDLAAAAVKPPRVPGDFPKRLETISSVACRAIMPYASGSQCQQRIDRENYFDALEIKPSDNRAGQTSAQQFHDWIDPHLVHKVPGEMASTTATTALDNAVQQRGLGALRINPSNPSLLTLNNASLSFSSVNHKFSDAQLKNLFPGSPVTQLTTPRGHTLQFDLPAKYSYSWEHVELFQAEELRYSAQYTGQPSAARIISQKQNLWSTDTGLALHVRNRKLPHLEPVFTFHTETQLWNPLPGFIESLASSGKPSVAQPFDLSRTYLLLPRAGLRWVDRVSWIEAGLESGGELNAVRLIPNPDNTDQLLLRRPNLRVNGVYWNWHTVVPFSSTVSWQIDEDGNYFFNNRDDKPIDTRFRSDSETALNFKVWPSLSFGPTYEIFLYSNKVQGIWFWQGQASMKMNVRFDFWNHREWTKEMRYSPTK
ncbi:MAG: 5'-nucleotidase C-terminal domain-containing protein [Acidobacteriia bacterium]|nr:5'-nucleotidase C-terminal domain-containing protein [Terriglobia bacterium]